MKALLVPILLFGWIMSIAVPLTANESFSLHNEIWRIWIAFFLLSVLFTIIFFRLKWENDYIYLFVKTRIKRTSKSISSSKDKMREELKDDQ
tara:strand:+ start:438 stop:713 length:276 start_codon:yes stop_codon:yes gene_type:complete